MWVPYAGVDRLDSDDSVTNTMAANTKPEFAPTAVRHPAGPSGHPPPARSSGSKGVGASWVLLLGFTLLFGSVSLIYPFGRDQATYAFMGDAILHGMTLYRDVPIGLPPMTVLVHVIAFVLFGRTMVAIRILDLLWTLATVGVLSLFVARAFRRPWLGAVAGIVYSSPGRGSNVSARQRAVGRQPESASSVPACLHVGRSLFLCRSRDGNRGALQVHHGPAGARRRLGAAPCEGAAAGRELACRGLVLRRQPCGRHDGTLRHLAVGRAARPTPGWPIISTMLPCPFACSGFRVSSLCWSC
jgi:hypothetical protein